MSKRQPNTTAKQKSAITLDPMVEHARRAYAAPTTVNSASINSADTSTLVDPMLEQARRGAIEGRALRKSDPEDVKLGEYIYVLVNSSMLGLCKIGKTTREPEARVTELSRGTGVPTPFILVWVEEVSDCTEAERLIHEDLSDKRESSKREFFRIGVQDAIVAVRDACD